MYCCRLLFEGPEHDMYCPDTDISNPWSECEQPPRGGIAGVTIIAYNAVNQQENVQPTLTSPGQFAYEHPPDQRLCARRNLQKSF